MIGKYLRQALTIKHPFGVYTGYAGLVLFSAAIAYIYCTITRHTIVPNPNEANTYLYLAACILVLGSVISCVTVYRNLQTAIAITITTSWLFLLITLAAIPAIETRTILPLAEKLIPILQPEDEVITYNQYYQDLPFYLQRRVGILNWHNELSYGMQHQDTRSWMLDDKTFWQHWNSRRVFVVMSVSEYEALLKNKPELTLYPLAKTTNNILITNKK